jgi:hypothetical protein
MISVSLGDLTGAFAALIEHKDKVRQKLSKDEINELRHGLSTLHFAKGGALDVLENRGLDDYIAILQRDTSNLVGEALERVWELVQCVDLPIETRESLIKIRTSKSLIRAEIARSLIQRDEGAVDSLITEIRELNQNILAVEKYLFEVQNG